MTAAGGTQGKGSADWVVRVFFIVVAVAIVVVLLREPGEAPPDELDPAEIVGAPLRVPGTGGDRLFLLTDQHLRRWEKRNRPSGRVMVDGSVHYSVHRWELWALDADSLEVLWRRVLREARPTIPSETPPRLLGSDGKHVWWQAGIAGAMPEGVPAQAPSPVGPQALGIDDGLAQSLRLPAGALAFLPVEPEHTVWRYQGGGVRWAERWLGLLTDEQAEGFQRDPVRGERWPEPNVPIANTKYRIWQALAAQPPTAASFGGPQQRFEAIRVLVPDEVFVQGGWLRQPATGETIAAADGAYVLHRGASIWLLDHVAADDGRRRWRVDLPQARFIAVLPGAGSLLVAGTRDGGFVPGTQYEQLGGTVLSAIALDSGQRTDFDLAQASLAREPAR